MEAFTGVSRKNLDRIAKAAEEGEEYPAARGVLAALHDAVSPIAADLEPWARR